MEIMVAMGHSFPVPCSLILEKHCALLLAPGAISLNKVGAVVFHYTAQVGVGGLLCSYKFAIQETTRGSDKKVYNYQGKRVKLAKPVVLKLKDKKTGKVKEVVKKFKNVITSLGSSSE